MSAILKLTQIQFRGGGAAGKQQVNWTEMD